MAVIAGIGYRAFEHLYSSGIIQDGIRVTVYRTPMDLKHFIPQACKPEVYELRGDMLDIVQPRIDGASEVRTVLWRRIWTVDVK